MNTIVSLLLCLTLAQAEAPKFVVDAVDGPSKPGVLKMLSDDFSLTLDSVPFPGKNVVGLRHETLPSPDHPDRNYVLLTNGDRLRFDAKAGCRLEQERLLVQPAAPVDGAEVRLSLSYVALVWLEAPIGVAEGELFLAKLQRETRPRDVLLLRNGDRIEGSLRGMNVKDGVHFDVDGNPRQVDWSLLAAVAPATELRARPRAKGAYAHVVLADGSRWSLKQVRLERDRLVGKPLVGGQIEVPLAQVRRLDVRQGPAVYLSDLPAASYRFTPYLGVHWPLGKDTSVVGRPLRLGPHTFDKGLGMHARSETTYALGGHYRWFEALVGLDARSGRGGRARVQVLVDGKEQIVDKQVRSGTSPPLPLRIDVQNARELTLLVDFDTSDVQAHVDWANARLLK